MTKVLKKKTKAAARPAGGRTKTFKKGQGNATPTGARATRRKTRSTRAPIQRRAVPPRLPEAPASRRRRGAARPWRPPFPTRGRCRPPKKARRRIHRLLPTPRVAEATYKGPRPVPQHEIYVSISRDCVCACIINITTLFSQSIQSHARRKPQHTAQGKPKPGKLNAEPR